MTFALLMVSAWGIGVGLLRPRSFETSFFALLIGLVCCSVWIIVAGSVSLSLARSGVLVAAVVSLLAIVVNLRTTSDTVRDLHLGERLDGLERLAIVAIAAGLIMSMVSSLAPVTNWDAGAAHLALPAAYERAGVIGVFESNNYSAYPHLAHALYTQAYGSGSELGVRLMSWVFAALCVGFTFCLGTRLCNRKAGLIGAAALTAAPIFADQAGTPAIDLVFACFVMASILALVAWRQEDEGVWLVLAGVLAGSACGVRHTGYLVASLLLLGVMLTGGSRAKRWGPLFACAVIVGSAPWLMRSWLLVGNPVYPFFASAFGTWGAYDADVASLATHDSMRAWGVAAFIRFPWSVVMAPDAFDGWSANPGVLVVLLGVPGILFGGHRVRMIALFCVSGVLAMFFFRQHVRYLLPFFLPMMAIAGVGAVRMPVARRAVMVVVCAALSLGILVQAAAVHYKIPVALGLESRDEYLGERIERYAAFQWAREHLPEDAVILSLDPRGYYFDRDCYQNFETLKTLVNADRDAQWAWIDEHGIDYVFYPNDYVLNSPGFRETGVQAVIERWRADRDRFALEVALELDRARDNGTELVEIYRVRREPDVLAQRAGE